MTFLYFFTSFVKFFMVASPVLVLPDCYLSNKLLVSSYVDKFYVFEGVDHGTVGDAHLALKSENYILLATKDTELFFVGLS